MFDSGFGGLTVARALIDLVPGEDLVYVGDTARVPYGPKSPDTVRRYSQEIADFILQVAARPSSTPASAPFTKALAMAVVGGIHELVLEAIEQERPDSLEALVVPASELVRAVALRQG